MTRSTSHCRRVAGDGEILRGEDPFPPLPLLPQAGLASFRRRHSPAAFADGIAAALSGLDRRVCRRPEDAVAAAAVDAAGVPGDYRRLAAHAAALRSRPQAAQDRFEVQKAAAADAAARGEGWAGGAVDWTPQGSSAEAVCEAAKVRARDAWAKRVMMPPRTAASSLRMCRKSLRPGEQRSRRCGERGASSCCRRAWVAAAATRSRSWRRCGVSGERMCSSSREPLPPPSSSAGRPSTRTTSPAERSTSLSQQPSARARRPRRRGAARASRPSSRRRSPCPPPLGTPPTSSFRGGGRRWTTRRTRRTGRRSSRRSRRRGTAPRGRLLAARRRSLQPASLLPLSPPRARRSRPSSARRRARTSSGGLPRRRPPAPAPPRPPASRTSLRSPQ